MLRPKPTSALESRSLHYNQPCILYVTSLNRIKFAFVVEYNSCKSKTWVDAKKF